MKSCVRVLTIVGMLCAQNGHAADNSPFNLGSTEYAAIIGGTSGAAVIGSYALSTHAGNVAAALEKELETVSKNVLIKMHAEIIDQEQRIAAAKHFDDSARMTLKASQEALEAQIAAAGKEFDRLSRSIGNKTITLAERARLVAEIEVKKASLKRLKSVLSQTINDISTLTRTQLSPAQLKQAEKFLASAKQGFFAEALKQKIISNEYVGGVLKEAVKGASFPAELAESITVRDRKMIFAETSDKKAKLESSIVRNKFYQKAGKYGVVLAAVGGVTATVFVVATRFEKVRDLISVSNLTADEIEQAVAELNPEEANEAFTVIGNILNQDT